tara:strand:- start:55 stop:261 length:207 start_codon:yes stop_codon:yes gene_type:complete
MSNLFSWFQGLFVKQMLNSKKFWYALIGVLTTLLSDTLGLNPEEVNNILMSIAALILGQGFADMNKKK